MGLDVLKGEVHSLLWLEPHKIEIGVEYLTLVIGVLISLPQIF